MKRARSSTDLPRPARPRPSMKASAVPPPKASPPATPMSPSPPAAVPSPSASLPEAAVPSPSASPPATPRKSPSPKPPAQDQVLSHDRLIELFEQAACKNHTTLEKILDDNGWSRFEEDDVDVEALEALAMQTANEVQEPAQEIDGEELEEEEDGEEEDEEEDDEEEDDEVQEHAQAMQTAEPSIDAAAAQTATQAATEASPKNSGMIGQSGNIAPKVGSMLSASSREFPERPPAPAPQTDILPMPTGSIVSAPAHIQTQASRNINAGSGLGFGVWVWCLGWKCCGACGWVWVLICGMVLGDGWLVGCGFGVGFVGRVKGVVWLGGFVWLVLWLVRWGVF